MQESNGVRTEAGEVGGAPGHPGPKAGQGEPLPVFLPQFHYRAVPACSIDAREMYRQCLLAVVHPSRSCPVLFLIFFGVGSAKATVADLPPLPCLEHRATMPRALRVQGSIALG